MDAAGLIFTGWEKEQKILNKNLSVLKKHPGKEAVHDLRVAVKKLRAILKLYFLLAGKPLPEYLLKETEQLFSILGKQRDIEICLEIIADSEKEYGKKYTEAENYFRSLLSVASARTLKAVQQYKKKETDETGLLLKPEIKIPGDEALKIRIAVIIHTHLAACQHYFNKPHKLRQSLKEIYYWIKMIPALFLQFEYEKELHDLPDDFGNWQNLTVFEIKLKHFRKDYLPKVLPEYEATKMLGTAVKEKKEKLLKLALNKTSSLLKKVSVTGN